jgi:hypothetical protein
MGDAVGGLAVCGLAGLPFGAAVGQAIGRAARQRIGAAVRQPLGAAVGHSFGRTIGGTAAGGVGTLRAEKDEQVSIQVLVETPQPVVAYLVIGGDAEAGKHGYEDEAVPNLHAPAYGVKEHQTYSMQ